MAANEVNGSELARLAGEPPSTIDFWADSGLLKFRRKGRRRLYAVEDNVARCARIREFQQEGMALATVKQMFDGRLPGQRPEAV